jgi:hypothetical protein
MPSGEARTVLTAFKVSRKEAALIREASEKAQVERSEWMRNAVLQALGIAS